MTKKYISRAEADVGFMFIAYNLRRFINILGADILKAYLEILLLLLIAKLRLIRLQYINSKPLSFLNNILKTDCENHKTSLKIAYIWPKIRKMGGF